MNVFLMFFLLSINEYIFVQSLWDTNTTKKKWPLLLWLRINLSIPRAICYTLILLRVVFNQSTILFLSWSVCLFIFLNDPNFFFLNSRIQVLLLSWKSRNMWSIYLYMIHINLRKKKKKRSNSKLFTHAVSNFIS